MKSQRNGSQTRNSLQKSVIGNHQEHFAERLSIPCNADPVGQSPPQNEVFPALEFLAARKGQMCAILKNDIANASNGTGCSNL